MVECMSIVCSDISVCDHAYADEAPVVQMHVLVAVQGCEAAWLRSSFVVCLNNAPSLSTRNGSFAQVVFAAPLLGPRAQTRM